MTQAEGEAAFQRLCLAAKIRADWPGAQARLARAILVTPTRVLQIRQGKCSPECVARHLAGLGDPELQETLERLASTRTAEIRKALGFAQ